MASGQEIFNRAATLLNDADHIRWPLPELCDWLNEGVRAICLAKPSASSATVVFTLIPGTLQRLPAVVDGVQPQILISINRNIVEPGARKAGRMIKHTNRGQLDAVEPDWHDRTRVQFRKEVRNYTFDEMTPREFYVYPGNDGTGMVEAVVGTLPLPLVPTGEPTDIASYDVQIGLPEPYSVPLLDYTLYRCQMKDDIDGAAGRAAVHYQQFAQALGIKVAVEKGHTPNARPGT